MGVNTNRLAYRFLTESDNWSAVVEKINYNFDQNKAFGGGDKGDIGNPGMRGLPGATGIGKKGDQGLKGATIAFTQTALTDGQAIISVDHREGDVIIDSNGSFFSIIKNNVGNLVYKFEYSLAATVSGSIVETETAILAQSANPIIKWFLRTTGDPKAANAMFVDRVVGAVTDEAQLYRVVIGDSGYPLLQNAAFTVVNILPSDVVTSAKQNFFAQIAFKYRSSPNSNVSSNTGYLRYMELNKNETSPVGPDDTYMLIDNVSAGFGAVHDALTTDASYALVRGKNVRFMGKTAMDQLYNNGTINNANSYLDAIIDTSLVSLISNRGMLMRSLTNEVVIGGGTYIAHDAPKHLFSTGIYIGAGNFNGANTYVPANGAVIEGAVGIGMTSAPYVANNVKLHVAGGIKLDALSAMMWGNTAGALEHIWKDDIVYQNVTSTFHFTKGNYKANGNAGIKSGAVFTTRGEIYDRLIIGDQGWHAGFAKGAAIQGEVLLNGKATVNGVFLTTGQTVINRGYDAFIGSADDAADYALWRYWNNNAAKLQYEWLGYRSSTDKWVLSWNGVERDLIHTGNGGNFYWRKNFAETGDYMEFHANGVSPTTALRVHQDNVGASYIQSWHFNSGAPTAYMHVNGTLYAQDVWILSDKKLKKNIKSIGSAWDIIKKLRPVSFQWKNDKTGATHTGMIAQETQTVIPHAVVESNIGSGALTVSNNEILPYVISCLQEAMKKIEYLEQQLAHLKK